VQGELIKLGHRIAASPPARQHRELVRRRSPRRRPARHPRLPPPDLLPARQGNRHRARFPCAIRPHRPPQTPGDGVKKQKDSEPNGPPGRRPLDYVIVVAASPWVKERYPAARVNLWDALQAGKDQHRDPEPEPDLEAEP
jgi:hypothetical protein